MPCNIKLYDATMKRGKASREWCKNGKPQYYCYGYIDKRDDELLDVCRNCRENVIYAQEDLEKLKESK